MLNLNGHRTYATVECEHCLIDLTEHEENIFDDDTKEFYKSLAQMIVDSYDNL
ncbi:hypothetical protein [Alkalihalobacterium elongatum]|uniref:hypothetical protein n=1 Tax=Alkalihalobacterium elongatum TaxID=2675466 RepID=UPI001C1FCEDA|nr:hypothetical protein [Alkalihalobacterium elongatum]